MSPIVAKSRRGRPPKYQHYWIAMAERRNAALREKQTKSGNAADIVPPEKYCTRDTTKKDRIRRQDMVVNRQGVENVVQNGCYQYQMDRQEWLLPEHGIDRKDINYYPQCLPTQLCSNFENATATDYEDEHLAKKFKPEDIIVNRCFSSSDLDFPNGTYPNFGDKVLMELGGTKLPVLVPFPAKAPLWVTVPGNIVNDCANSNIKASMALNGAELDRLNCTGGAVSSQRILNSDLEWKSSFSENFNGSSFAVDTSSSKNHELWTPIDLSCHKKQNQEENVSSSDFPDMIASPRLSASQETTEEIQHKGQSGDIRQTDGFYSTNDGTSSIPPDFSFRTFPEKPFSHLKEIATWSVDQVVHFVSSIPGCHDYAECFRDEDIDGLTLLRLSEYHLLNVIRMKLGPALHLKRAIERLAGHVAHSTL